MSGPRPRRDLLDAAPAQGADEDVWLMTYLDVFTLLLVMMVVLLAFAQPTPAKEAGTGEAQQEAAPAGFLQALTAELKKKGDPLEGLPLDQLGPDVQVVVEEGAVRFRISSQMLFDPAQAQLMGPGLDVLDRIAAVLKQAKRAQVVVEGHTDTAPIQTERFPSNWELSAARASAVVRYLAARGVEPARLRATGCADTRPVASNETPEGRAANRRVELLLESLPR